jgi:hypothetical protein
MEVSEHVKPVRAMVEGWERGLDPWHADAFPDEFKYIGATGERMAGWYALDGFGNVIGFIPDGSPAHLTD